MDRVIAALTYSLLIHELVRMAVPPGWLLNCHHSCAGGSASKEMRPCLTDTDALFVVEAKVRPQEDAYGSHNFSSPRISAPSFSWACLLGIVNIMLISRFGLTNGPNAPAMMQKLSGNEICWAWQSVEVKYLYQAEGGAGLFGSYEKY